MTTPQPQPRPMKRYTPSTDPSGHPEMVESTTGRFVLIDDPAIAAAVTAMEAASKYLDNISDMDGDRPDRLHVALVLALANLTKGTA